MRAYMHRYADAYEYIQVMIMCVCVCVCVCTYYIFFSPYLHGNEGEKVQPEFRVISCHVIVEGERGREGKGGGGGGREGASICLSHFNFVIFDTSWIYILALFI